MESVSHIVKLLDLSEEHALSVLPTLIELKGQIDALTIPVNKIMLVKRVLKLVKEIINGKYRLIIIRGAAGSGKSSLAIQIKLIHEILTRKQMCRICEADTYMGKTFDASKLENCHQQCQQSARTGLQNGELVIVSNTNTSLAEMEIYRKIMEELKMFEKQILILEPFTPWKYDISLCKERCNKPNIPEHIIGRHIQNILDNPTGQQLIAKMRGAKR